MQNKCNNETVQARIADDQAPSIFLPLANFHGKISKFSKFSKLFLDFFSEYYDAIKSYFKSN
jgi:hypothetical protein